MTVRPIDPGALSLVAAGLQAQLQLAFPPERFQFEFMPPRLSAKEWQRLVQRPPFVGLGWNDVTAQSNGSKLFKGDSHWTVFLVTSNPAAIKLRYLGDKQGPGLFQLVQAAIVATNAFTIRDADGQCVGSCFAQRAANAYAEGWEAEHLAMAAVDISVNVAMSVATALSGPEATPELLRLIGTSWVFSDAGSGAQINDLSTFGEAA